MSVRLIHRPARTTVGASRPDEVKLAAPPMLGNAPLGGGALQAALPVVGSLSSVAMMVVARSNPVLMVVGAMVLVVALAGGVGMAVSSRGREIRARRRTRGRYLEYLEQTRSELRAEGERAREARLLLHPAPARLPQIVANPARLWERRPSDGDFAELRLGTGLMPWFRLSVPPQANPVEPADPIMLAEAEQLCVAHHLIGGMPVTFSLRTHPTISIVGPAAQGREIARSLVAQLASFHAPDDVHLAFAIAPGVIPEWEGIELLPHAQKPEQWDGPIPARRIAPDPARLSVVMQDELADRRAHAIAQRGNDTASEPLLVMVADTPAEATQLRVLSHTGTNGVALIAVVTNRLDEPGETSLRITVAENGAAQVEVLGEEDPIQAHSDRMPLALFSGLAASLAPLRLSADSRSEGGTLRELSVLEILGVEAVSDIGPKQWVHHSGPAFLRAPIGTDDNGAEVSIDLKESAQSGMGPHGICIGATGSGKSELLRTLLLSLSVRHSPEDLTMILVDYKGGAAFRPFQALPHVVGLIDNLEGEAGLIERARTSINGEVVRRQQLLKDAGGFDSITNYRAARTSNPKLEPMPHLMLVIDEFGELLTAEQDFIDLLLTIGRIGRSIGVHMLLSSQRIESGKLKGLDTYLSYRIGLRTFSEQESQVILNTSDAFSLPAIPGYGYLKVDTTVYSRFKSGYVTGPTPGPVVTIDGRIPPLPLPPYNILRREIDRLIPETASITGGQTPLIENAIARLHAPHLAAPAVWLPPLPDRVSLFQLPDISREGLEIPVGLIDDPAHQQQSTWTIDLSRAGGHFAVIGAPQSGRTTALRTITASIASSLTPTQVTVYGLDLTGAGLSRLEVFPHVGGIATRGDNEAQLRLLEELLAMLSTRERVFREHHIESLNHFRLLHAEGRFPEIVSADVVLLVDGYGHVREAFDHLAPPLADLLNRGSSYGVHVITALTRWGELTSALQPLIGTRIELRLNDPADSTIFRRLAATITIAGRALTEQKLFAHFALPTIDEVPDERLGEALSSLAERVAASWSGPTAAPIRRLPEHLPMAELPNEHDEPARIPLGLRQDTMQPALLELPGRDQHVIVLGDPETGKTGLLELIVTSLTARHSPDELVIAVMESRGRLASLVPDDYLGGHAQNGRAGWELATAVATELDKRQNAGKQGGTSFEKSPEEGSSKAKPPRVVVIADDLESLSAGGIAPLDPLLPFLPQARDLDLHVIITRLVSGSQRAFMSPLLQTLKDLGATGVLFSGERAEGQLWPGVWAAPAIPGRARLVRRGEPPRQIQIAELGS